MSGGKWDHLLGKDARARVGGTEGHHLRFNEANNRITDRFGDAEAIDDERYRAQLTADPATAAAELAKLHPLVASRRPPKKALFRRYAKLLGEARGRPLSSDEERRLRRELALAPPDDDGLRAVRAALG